MSTISATTIPSAAQTKKKLSLRSMLNRNMSALKAEFAVLDESDFKKEIARRYKSAIGTYCLLLIRLKLYREARQSLDNLESKLKLIGKPLDINFETFMKAKKSVQNLFIPQTIIKLKPNTSAQQLSSLLTAIYFATDVTPGERRQLQNSVKRNFYESVFYVDRCIYLRFPKKHKAIFDWFLDEKVLKHKSLLRQLRQSHSRPTTDRESFLRSYRNNK